MAKVPMCVSVSIPVTLCYLARAQLACVSNPLEGELSGCQDCAKRAPWSCICELSAAPFFFVTLHVRCLEYCVNCC